MSRHITLIRPPLISARLSYSMAVLPPLGPAYLAASLLEAGHRVAGIDAAGEAPLQQGPTPEGDLVYNGLSIPEILERIQPDTDAVAFSVMFSIQWPHVARIIDAVHERLPAVPILVGGEHLAGTWQYVLDSSKAVTACAVGEGEDTIVELARWLDGERALEEIEGVAYRRDGRPVLNPRRARIRDVDAIPRPAWEVFDIERFLGSGFNYGVERGRSMPILATRGCPYQCTFCSSPSMWTTRYITRTVGLVVDEIQEYVERFGVTNIDFYDLTAIIKRDWILEFCKELERRELDITFQLPSGTRSEALDAEVLEALARTGCCNICYAPESGSLRTLKAIKKRLTPEGILKSVRIAKRVGVTVKTNLIIGFPDETRWDIFETIRFGLRLAWVGADDIPLFLFCPYPASELYEQLRADGTLPEMSNDYFASLAYMDLGNSPSFSRQIGTRELGMIRVVGMSLIGALGYIRRPWRIWRTVRNVLADRSDTLTEQRLLESKRRWAVKRSRKKLLAPGAALAPGGKR